MRHPKIRNTVLAAFILSSTLIPIAAIAQVNIDPSILTPQQRQQIKPNLKVVPKLPPAVLSCPDPAVEAVTVQWISGGPTTGRIRISGVVKNIGGASYVSRSGQQLFSLYEDNRVISNLDFGNLAPGESSPPIKLELEWSTSSEFNPNYRFEISYDPDIYIDGNPQNDDCRRGNNSKPVNMP